MSRYPGFDWVVSPTHDWRAPSSGPYHWAAYERDGTEHHGFADNAQLAKGQAMAALVNALYRNEEE